MSSATSHKVLCCSNAVPYKPHYIGAESYFTSFLSWECNAAAVTPTHSQPFIIQTVEQVNFGPIRGAKYFKYNPDSNTFIDSSQREVIDENYEKGNAFKKSEE